MDGSQCRREAVPGTNVCNEHGALTPAVQASAALRIQMSVDDAVKRLHEMLDDSAVDARDKIKILHDLLDRGGLGATSKVLVAVGQIDPVEKLFASILSGPNATYDPHVVQPKQITRDAAQEALDAVEDVPDWDGFLARRGPVSRDDVVVERVSTLPPKHILEDLERLGLL